MNENVAQRNDVDNETLDLWQRYIETKNIEIRNKLVLIYMPLIKKIAFKVFQNYPCADSMDELVSEGMVALINAIDRFDLERDVKFETYVSYRIQGSMLDYINKQNGYVRKVHEISKEITNAKNQLGVQLGREPTKSEVADFLGLSMEELDKKYQEIQPISFISLDQMTRDSNMDEKTFEVSSGPKDDPDVIVDQDVYSDTLVNSIKKLNKEQQLVLSLFYKEELSVTEIADIMNTNSQRVSQVRFQAIKKLKKVMSGDTED